MNVSFARLSLRHLFTRFSRAPSRRSRRPSTARWTPRAEDLESRRLLALTGVLPSENFDWGGVPNQGGYAGLKHTSLALTNPRLMKVNVMQIDVTTPGLRFYATPAGGSVEAVTQTTRQFINTSRAAGKGMVAAINSMPWTPFTPSNWNRPEDVDLDGLAVSEGSLVSPGNGRPTFLVSTSGTPSVAVTNATTSIAGVRTAVSGFSIVLQNGIPVPVSNDLHPRTGVGVSADARFVYLATIDGRQSGWSDGATPEEVGELLEYYGAADGINMDGGGSTTMAWWDPLTPGNGSDLLNRPVGAGGSTPNRERHNGANLGIHFVPPPSLTIAAAAADKPEGTGAAPTSFTFTVSRSGDTAEASSASWAVSGSGANPATAADFTGGTLPGGTVSFAAGETTKTITVGVAGDALVEADEGFIVTLSSPTGATLGSATEATGTIRNDDFPPPSLTIAAAAADKPEGTGAAPTSFTFTVTRTGSTTGASSASWTVSGSGANPATAADFTGGTLPSGTVSFAAGEITKTIAVNVAGDAVAEPDEGFTVMLSAPTGATLGVPAQAGTIHNDDARSRISIAATDAVKAEGDVGRTPFTFTLNRSGDLRGHVSVPWRVEVSGANRADRFDFIGGVLPSGTIRLAAGRPTQALTVNVFRDRFAEFDEQFTITLGPPLGGLDVLEPGLGSAAGVIRNDDAGTPRPATTQPAQGQPLAELAALAFATLAETSGSTGTTPAKRSSTVSVFRA